MRKTAKQAIIATVFKLLVYLKEGLHLLCVRVYLACTKCYVRRIYTVIYIGQVATEHVIGEIRFVVSTSNRGSYRRRADITNPLK